MLGLAKLANRSWPTKRPRMRRLKLRQDCRWLVAAASGPVAGPRRPRVPDEALRLSLSLALIAVAMPLIVDRCRLRKAGQTLLQLKLRRARCLCALGVLPLLLLRGWW